jgi:hypothetical protein
MTEFKVGDRVTHTAQPDTQGTIDTLEPWANEPGAVVRWDGEFFNRGMDHHPLRSLRKVES